VNTAIFVSQAHKPRQNSLFLGKITDVINPDKAWNKLFQNGTNLVKGTAIPVQIMKASGGNGGSTPLINFSSICTWVASFTIRPFYPRVK
jgi:hypothetical protein